MILTVFVCMVFSLFEFHARSLTTNNDGRGGITHLNEPLFPLGHLMAGCRMHNGLVGIVARIGALVLLR